MLRTCRVAGVAGLLAAGAALAAPKTTDLFPTKLGSVWVYKLGTEEVTVTVTGTETFGGKECARFEEKVGSGPATKYLHFVAADGVFRARVNAVAVDPPLKLLPLPADKGTAWVVDSKVGTVRVKGEFKVRAVDEKVTVPAGDFTCVFVEGPDVDIAGTKTAVRQYYAPGTGLVKEVLEAGGVASVRELKSYTPGK
ncbi:MAG: hypothetical protein K2X87_22130 [Gemmataceae bacterium]|nr:hypothetical protein [Gemmataceae bacterium]